MDLNVLAEKVEAYEKQLELEWPRMTEAQKIECVKKQWVPRRLLEKEKRRYKQSKLQEECKRRLYRDYRGSSNAFAFSEMGQIEATLFWDQEKRKQQAIELSQQIELPPNEIFKILTEAKGYFMEHLSYELDALLEKLNKKALAYATKEMAKAAEKKDAVRKLKKLLDAKNAGRDTKPDPGQEEIERKGRDMEKKTISAMRALIRQKKRLDLENVAQEMENAKKEGERKSKSQNPKSLATMLSKRLNFHGLYLEEMKIKARKAEKKSEASFLSINRQKKES